MFSVRQRRLNSQLFIELAQRRQHTAEVSGGARASTAEAGVRADCCVGRVRFEDSATGSNVRLSYRNVFVISQKSCKTCILPDAVEHLVASRNNANVVSNVLKPYCRNSHIRGGHGVTGVGASTSAISRNTAQLPKRSSLLRSSQASI